MKIYVETIRDILNRECLEDDQDYDLKALPDLLCGVDLEKVCAALAEAAETCPDLAAEIEEISRQSVTHVSG